MKKWPLLFAVVAVGVIGCAGGGSNNGGTTGAGGVTGSTAGGGTTGRSAQGVDIPVALGNISTVDAYILPGQGRQTTNYTAVVRFLDLVDNLGFHTYTENPEEPSVSVGLNGYNPINIILNAAVPGPGSAGSRNSRYFPTFDIDFSDLQASGQDFPGDQQYNFINNASITTFPGRFTAVQLYLNDAMFNWPADPSQGNPTLDQNQFLTANTNPQDGKIDGFLSDYLSFDITNVPQKPSFTNFPGNAYRIFVSGDFFAEGDKTPANSSTYANFEVLTAYGALPGSYKTTDPIVGIAPYLVTQPNPNTLSLNPGTITSLEGPWFDSTQRITATDSTLMISFPGNKDTAVQEMVIINRTGSKITSMYFGTLNFNGAGGATFNAFPIADLEPGSVAGKVSGTVSSLVDASGVSVSKTGSWWQNVRQGTYSITSGTPSGIASSARLVVYRA